MRETIRRIKQNIDGFWYNFGWSDWVPFIDGWIPKFAFFVPIVGYLIIFADHLGGSLQFKALLGGHVEFGITSSQRLRLVYFGLFALGVSNFIYRIRRPYQFRFGTNRLDYTKTCLEAFTYQDFLHLHQDIRSKAHYTIDGKYYDSEWKGFSDAALNRGEGTDSVERTGHWEDAKSRYGSLLRSILAETFFRVNLVRRGSLILCILISGAGYILLTIPSVDLLVKVVLGSLGGEG